MKQTAHTIQSLYPKMTAEYQNDYEEIRLLLSSPARMFEQLECLEAAMKDIRPEDNRLGQTYLDHKGIPSQFDELEVALADMERRFSFSEVIDIPLGGTPFSDPNYGSNRISVEKWTAMIQGGHPFRDYGASRPHGEITHRIQWYLICAAYESDDLSLSNNNRSRIIDLYRAATLPEHRRLYHRPSDGVSYMKTVWTDLFDYGLTKVIDGRCTLWIQRELMFCDGKNYFPSLSGALAKRFLARGGSLDPWHPDNWQFFDGSGDHGGVHSR